MVKDINIGDKILSFQDGRAIYRAVIGKESYVKKCVKIDLLSGRKLKLSDDHPVLTQRGWIKASLLNEQHYLIRLCSEINGEKAINDHVLDFVTMMIFDGGCSHKSSLTFTNDDEQIVKLFYETCGKLGIKVHQRPSHKRFEYSVLGGENGKAKRILKEFGIDGHLSINKRLPKQFYNLPIEQKFRFISLMIATDGFITKHHGNVAITLGNEDLINDISLFLDTCGIPSTSYGYDNNHNGSFSLMISPYHSRKLSGKVDFLHKQELFNKVCNHDGKKVSLNFGYPQDICKGLTYKFKQVKPKINTKYNRPITEYLFNRIKTEIDPTVTRFEMEDFIYDRVKSIQSIGERKVYHLSIDADEYDNKNYLANNLVVHNTSMAVIHYIARGLAIDPRNRFLHLSYSGDLAYQNSSSARRIIKSYEFQQMWNINTRNDSDSVSTWWTLEGGGVRATSTGGQVTGFRAGHMDADKFTGALLIDDPIKPDDALSKTKREAINDGYNDTIASRLAVETVPIVVIMQRVGYRDMSGFLLRGGSGEMWYHLNLPVFIDSNEIYPEENTHAIPIDHKLPPGWLWSYKHNKTHEVALRAQRRKWFGQYMQAPKKMEDMAAMWTEETIKKARRWDDTEPRRRLVSIDPAISDTDESDEHGILVGTQISDTLFGIEADYTCKGTPKYWAERAIMAYNKHAADAIVIEVNQGGDMCEDTLRNAGYEGRVIRVRASKGKTIRSEPIAALYELEYVMHATGLIKLEDEMMDFDALTGQSGGKSPNRVDALVWLLTELSGYGLQFERLLELAVGE